MLKKVARILAGGCRESDVLARYGGEEFLVCFPGTGVAAAAEICERLRHAIESADWSALAPDIRVSLSAGVARHAAGTDTQHAAEGCGRASLPREACGTQSRGCVLDRYFFWLALSIIASASCDEQFSDSSSSNGASCSVCFGTVQGLLSTFGSSTTASISSVFASTRR